jgi:hypothetical protein
MRNFTTASKGEMALWGLASRWSRLDSHLGTGRIASRHISYPRTLARPARWPLRFFLAREMGSEAHSMKSTLGKINAKAIGSLAIFILVLVWWWSPLAPIGIDQFRFRIGEHVLAKSKGDGFFYPGEIRDVKEGKYRIVYDSHANEWVEENDLIPRNVPNESELHENMKVYVQIDQIHNRWVPAIIKHAEPNKNYWVEFTDNDNSRYQRVPLQKIVR